MYLLERTSHSHAVHRGPSHHAIPYPSKQSDVEMYSAVQRIVWPSCEIPVLQTASPSSHGMSRARASLSGVLVITVFARM